MEEEEDDDEEEEEEWKEKKKGNKEHAIFAFWPHPFRSLFLFIFWSFAKSTGFYLVLLGFTGFHWVSLGSTGFYWVLPSLS